MIGASSTTALRSYQYETAESRRVSGVARGIARRTEVRSELGLDSSILRMFMRAPATRRRWSRVAVIGSATVE